MVSLYDRSLKRFLSSLVLYTPTLILFTILFLGLVGGCQWKPLSRGEAGELVIVADEWDRPILQPFIGKTFGQVIMTPQSEPQFNIQWIDAGQLGNYTRAPLLLFAAPIEGEGPTAQLLGKMLTEEVKDGIKRGEYGVFRKRDPWARWQLLLVVTGWTRRQLGENLVRYTDSLYRWGYQFELERLNYEMFRKGEQKGLQRELVRRYGFSIRIQHDYFLSEESDTNRYWRIMRHHPERWVMVAWDTLKSPQLFTPQRVLERRKLLSTTFNDPVEVLEEYLVVERTQFLTHSALKIRGLWATVSPLGGGPFISYSFVDSASGRYFIIDGAVFAPGQTKMPFLWQVDAIAHTFQLGNADHQ